jgi:hypothetical protein
MSTSPKWPLYFGFLPPKSCTHPLPSLACCTPSLLHPTFDEIDNMQWEAPIQRAELCRFPQPLLLYFMSRRLLGTVFSNTRSLCSFHNTRDQFSDPLLSRHYHHQMVPFTHDQNQTHGRRTTQKAFMLILVIKSE